MSNADPQLIQARTVGSRPCGQVTLRDFDQGMVESLGARVIDGQYYITLDGVAPPPGEPGIPVHFFFPEDLYTNHRFPVFVVTRDDISISNMRYHPFMGQYRAPSPTALPITVQTPSGPREYYTRTIQQEQATPYDLTYTVNIYSSLRGGFGGRRAANVMLDHVLRICPIYGQIFVKDSLGDTRSYEAFNEGIVSLDDVAGISERMIQFAVTIRVEAEYDLAPVLEAPTTTSRPQTTLSQT